MGFKLGTERGNYAVSGEIRTKMRFHQEAGGDASVPGPPVIRKDLEPGISGEANMDGSIYVNENIVPGSYEDRQTISHEMRHATDMKIGKLAYDDDHIMYNGETETTTTTKSTTSKFRRFFTGKKYKGSGTTRTSTTDPSGKVTRIESSTRWKNR